MLAKTAWQQELDNARTFRKQGNEGKARVCARRAVGFAIHRHLVDSGKPSTNANAMHAMDALLLTPNLPTEIATAIGALLQRVTPAGELQGGPDLIASAEQVIVYLFPGQRAVGP